MPIPDIGYVTKLLKILLENNEFEFNGNLYKQILGAIMGAVPSPEICDLRLFDILENIIKNITTETYLWHTTDDWRFYGHSLIDATEN